MKNEAINIAIDVGSGYTKYLEIRPEHEKSFSKQVQSIKTLVGLAKDGAIQPGHKPQIIKFNDQEYFVGQTVDIMLSPTERVNTLSRDWASEDGHLALIFYIIACVLNSHNIDCSVSPQDIRIVTGLPQAFYADGADKMRKAIQGEHTFHYQGKNFQINITDVEIVPQAMGGYFSAASSFLNDDEVSQRVGIIDIGTYTTDFCLAEELEYHAWESGGQSIGVSNLISTLGDIIEREFGSRYSQESLQKAFKSRAILSRASMVPIDRQINEAVATIGNKLIQSLPKEWQTDAMHLVLAGGGAEKYFFGEFMRSKFPHIQIMDNPSTAIVLGYAIYGNDIFEKDE